MKWTYIHSRHKCDKSKYKYCDHIHVIGIYWDCGAEWLRVVSLTLVSFTHLILV